MESEAIRLAIDRLHRMCVEHARRARALVRELRHEGMAVLPQTRRLMLEARANLEQWRVAVLRSDEFGDAEREVIQTVMGVARGDVGASYTMVARELKGETARQTVEYALRRTRRAMMAVLIEIARIAPSGQEVAELQQEELEHALHTRATYGRLALELDLSHGAIGERLAIARRQIEQLLSPDCTAELRLADVASFEALIDRIDDWQQSPVDTPGEQLWSEVLAVAGLIRGINQREVLRSHDRDLLSQVQAWLTDDVDPEPALNDHWDSLGALFGLDLQIDRLLIEPRAALGSDQSETLRVRLNDLAAALGL